MTAPRVPATLPSSGILPALPTLTPPQTFPEARPLWAVVLRRGYRELRPGNLPTPTFLSCSSPPPLHGDPDVLTLT